MNLIRYAISELRHRPWTALLTVAITTCAVAAVLFFLGLSASLANRTRMIQRDLGLNVRFIPADNQLDRYWIRGYADGVIEEQLVDRLVSQDVANRLVPMLQRTIPFGAGEAILTGIGEERFAGGKTKKPVFGGLTQDPDVVVLGAVAAEIAELKEGDSTEILGHPFRVERVLVGEGSVDDLRVHADLKTVQQLLGMEGKINEIRALECNCDASVTDPEEQLRQTLEPMLPGTMMIRSDKMAEARRQQRQLADRLASTAASWIVILACVLVSALIGLNAYQRRRELGLFSAIGRGQLFVGSMIWLRAVSLGIAGGLLGTVLASGLLDRWDGPGTTGIGPALQWVAGQATVGIALGAAIPSVAALLPIFTLARVDPAILLRSE